LKKLGTLIIIILLPGMVIQADELKWEPINPSFGGNSYNGSWLLGSAQAQDSILGEQEEDKDLTETDPNEQFQESLNRLILSRLSSKLVDAITADGELTPGHFEIGTYSVTIVDQGNVFIVTLDDLATGGHTVIEIPAT
jgi:curli production assembly/transport component CsgF